MLRLSLVFSLLLSLFFQGHGQDWSEENCPDRPVITEVAQSHFSRFALGIFSCLESEEIDSEVENEEHESKRLFLKRLSNQANFTLYLLDSFPLHPTNLYSNSTQKKTALFVLFDQLLI